MTWRSIKSVPKKPLDRFGYGPAVLLFVDKKVGFGYWDRDFDRMYVEYPELVNSFDATHWKPLPKPPR